PPATAIHTLSLHDALPIWVVLLAQREADRRAGEIEGFAQAVDQRTLVVVRHRVGAGTEHHEARRTRLGLRDVVELEPPARHRGRDRKSTRLNSSHRTISYA